MATPRTITSNTDALGAGWSFNGSGSNWYGELPVQCGGKIVACGATSAALITAIQQAELNQAYWDSGNSSRDSTFSGCVV